MGNPGPPSMLVVIWEFPVVSETFVVEHLIGMADRGWAVTVCCVRLDDDRLAAQHGLGRRLRGLVVLGDAVESPSWVTRIRRLRAAGELRAWRSATVRHATNLAPALRGVVRAVRPDVVHAHFGPNAAAAGLAVRDDPTPVIADFHGFDVTVVPRREGWSGYRRLLAGQTLVVNSPFSARQIRQGMGVEPHRVPYGASADFVAPERPDAWSRPLRLLFVGRLVPQKGVDVAITAVAALVDRRPEIDPRLTIVGAGPCEADLRRRADELGLASRVDFVGARSHPDVVAAMRSHEMLLVPSREADDGWAEGFGKVAAEGMSSGMAVIASRSGGLPDTLGDDGSLVPPEDPMALADEVERLLDHSSPARVRARIPPDRPTLDDTWDDYDRLSRGLVASRGVGRTR